jgi:hypothetical protein
MTTGASGTARPEPRVVPTRNGGPVCDLPVVHELTVGEFASAATVWHDYHETTGDPAQDRIFGISCEGELVSLARCRRHNGGLEVDGIFTPATHRRRGFSRLAVGALVEACHNDDLYMYAVHHLVDFYAGFGFLPIPEKSLPPTIRERYTWAAGNLEGAEVQPMCRKAGSGRIFSP